MLRHVAQRLDHRDQLAVFVIDRTSIYRQIEAFADARHDTPDFGAQSEAAIAMDHVGLIEVAKFLGLPECQNVGQTVAGRVIEASPLVAGAEHLGGGRSGVRMPYSR